MELSGEGSDVDMIQYEDDSDESEPSEVSPLCMWGSGAPAHYLLQDVKSDGLSPPPLPRKPQLKLPQILSLNEFTSIMTHGRLVVDMDVESEGDDDDDVGGSTRPMTSRQAVLASVVDSSHVSLCLSPLSVHRPKGSRPLQQSPLAKTAHRI